MLQRSLLQFFLNTYFRKHNMVMALVHTLTDIFNDEIALIYNSFKYLITQIYVRKHNNVALYTHSDQHTVILTPCTTIFLSLTLANRTWTHYLIRLRRQLSETQSIQHCVILRHNNTLHSKFEITPGLTIFSINSTQHAATLVELMPIVSRRTTK